MRESVIFQDILEEGRQEEAIKMVMRVVTRCFGTVDLNLQARIRQLTTSQLEDLNEALWDFSSVADMSAWLQEQGK